MGMRKEKEREGGVGEERRMEEKLQGASFGRFQKSVPDNTVLAQYTSGGTSMTEDSPTGVSSLMNTGFSM